MKITVVGGGWVGLVAAACYSEFGSFVGVVDTNKKKIENLKQNMISVYEPGLEAIIKKGQEKENIKFSDDITDFLPDSDAIVIAVATIGENGEDADLSLLHSTINDISLLLRRDKYVAIFIKSLVPIGTCATIIRNMNFIRPDLIPGEHYDIIANPYFFREGYAIHDFMSPSRVVIGLSEDSKKAKEVLSEVYQPIIIQSNNPVVFTNLETAELTRYASTGFVVAKMAFINEMAELCDRVGADINMLIKGVGLDRRIGQNGLNITPGFGGSSTPRSSRILIETAETLGCELSVLKGVLKSNQNRINNVVKKIIGCIEDEKGIVGKVVSILGLSYKPQTDDIKDSPSISVISELLKAGVEVALYDPIYTLGSYKLSNIPSSITSNENFTATASVYDAINESDAMVIMTDWVEFRTIDFEKVQELMSKRLGSNPIIIDFRNMFSPCDMKDFRYISQGQIN